MKTKFKKVFIDESKWSEVNMWLRSKNITWDGNGHFQFDIATLVISIIGVVIGFIIGIAIW